MADDEPTTIAAILKMQRCAVCGVPLEPTEASFCAAHRQHEGKRGGGHHLTEALLLGFFLLAAMLAVLLIFA